MKRNLLCVVIGLAVINSGEVTAAPLIRAFTFNTANGETNFLHYKRNQTAVTISPAPNATSTTYRNNIQSEPVGKLRLGDDDKVIYTGVANRSTGFFPDPPFAGVTFSYGTQLTSFQTQGFVNFSQQSLQFPGSLDFNDVNLNHFPSGVVRNTQTSPAVSTAVNMTSLREITWKDIIRNKRSFQEPIVEEATINAYFTPHIRIGQDNVPVSLEMAAGLLGVDHFNWKNTVTVPSEYTISLDADGVLGTTEDRTPVDERLQLDPIQNPVSRYVYTVQNDNVLPSMRSLLVGIKGTPDLYPYYWNEDDDLNLSVNESSTTTTDFLKFEDSPMSPVWLDHTGDPRPEIRETRYFTTELVGVKDDKTEVPTGVSFIWKTDAKYFLHPSLILSGQAELISYQATRYSDTLPAVVAGGVFDVQVFSVPEPSAFVILTTAMIQLATRRRRPR